jgi:aminoglycoside 3-N-acetyltransferase
MTDTRDAQGRALLTRSQIAAQLRALGVQPGHTVMLHNSLKSFNAFIPGGPEAVLLAVFDVLGDDGTVMMAAQSSNNSDPAHWSRPPVPEEWWAAIRAEMPPYDPRTTRTDGLGALAEYFRTAPGTRRTDHPNLSFCARGRHAASLTATQPWDAPFGEDSPLGRFVALGGYVLLLGVGHAANTTLHLAEHRATWPSKRGMTQGASVWREGRQQWVTLDETVDYDNDDFEQIGEAYERSIGYTPARVGEAATRYLQAAPLVAFATTWMRENRG